MHCNFNVFGTAFIYPQDFLSRARVHNRQFSTAFSVNELVVDEELRATSCTSNLCTAGNIMISYGV